MERGPPTLECSQVVSRLFRALRGCFAPLRSSGSPAPVDSRQIDDSRSFTSRYSPGVGLGSSAQVHRVQAAPLAYTVYSRKRPLEKCAVLPTAEHVTMGSLRD
eukprot:5815347-Prymnesium_polylepis.1